MQEPHVVRNGDSPACTASSAVPSLGAQCLQVQEPDYVALSGTEFTKLDQNLNCTPTGYMLAEQSDDITSQPYVDYYPALIYTRINQDPEQQHKGLEERLRIDAYFPLDDKEMKGLPIEKGRTINDRNSSNVLHHFFGEDNCFRSNGLFKCLEDSSLKDLQEIPYFFILLLHFYTYF